MKKNIFRIGIDAIIVAIYFAMSPVHGALDLGNGTSLTKYLALIVIIFIFINKMLGRKNKKITTQNLVYIIPFFIWITLSVIWSPNKFLAIKALISYFSYLVLFLLCISNDWSKEEINFFKIIYIISCLYFSKLLLSLSVLQTGRTTLTLTDTGTFADQNVLTINIGIAVLFLIDYIIKCKYFYIRIIYIFMIFFIIYAMFSTGSRGGILSLIFSSVYLIYKQSKININYFKKSIMIVVVFICSFFIIVFSQFSNLNDTIISRYTKIEEMQDGSGRVDIWKHYFDIMNQEKSIYLLGTGIGGEIDTLIKIDGRFFGHVTHNEVLHLVYAYGIVGLFLFMYFINFIYKQAKFNKDYLAIACIICILIGTLDVNMIQSFGFWNILIFSCIGIGVTRSETNENN